ncbi:MAG: response regulator [Myxococcaceae bacterium]|nr:response regulator [Myxococcaceae bacterium]
MGTRHGTGPGDGDDLDAAELRAECRRLEAEVALAGARLERLAQVERLHRSGQEALERNLEAARERVQVVEEELERLRDRLSAAQRLEALGRVTGGVAHDFNNLLTVILTHARFARTALADGSSAAQDLDRVVDAATRGTRLTGQLLSAGRTPGCRPSVLDLNAVTHELLQLLQEAFAPGTAVTLELDPSVGNVRFDPVHLEQVLLNLVSNARDAMPGGGTLTVGSRPALQADWPGASVENMVTLTVRDTGVGIPPQTQARLFEPYFTTKPVGQGTGLGLSTAQDLMQQNGGHLSLVSAPGQGTTVRIVLPRAEAGGAPLRPVPAPRPRPKVMVVEDEDLVRRMACRVLRRNGFDVFEARDGQEALASLGREPAPDLVLTDLMMPSLGGRELAQVLRERSPGLKVLFMSGLDLSQVVQETGWLEREQFLPKPFTAEELTRAISSTLAN